MAAPSTPIIALDWGTSRLRACLLARDGTVLARRNSNQGIATIAPGGFTAVFAAMAGDWCSSHRDAPVILCGMIGSRNGWVEAPYVPCPAGWSDLVAKAIAVEVMPGRTAYLIPGMSCDEGQFDVMRGEETLAFGVGRTDGLVCLPGTHSKWVLLQQGRIIRFASFMTGEFYGLLRHHSLLSRLAAQEQGDDAHIGLTGGLAASARVGGLLNSAFSARSNVLAGRLPPGAVSGYLSGLLVGQEVLGAKALFARAEAEILPPVTLVAEGEVLASYAAALSAQGLTFEVVSPEVAFAGGILSFVDVIEAAS